MTRIALTTAVATLALAGAAHAADLRAPVYKAPPLAPVYSWTGFYIGLNAGLGVGQNDSAISIPALTGFPTFTHSPLGAIGGAQAGYNWQFGNWVLGLEADIQASSMNDEACVLNCQVGGASARVKQELGWFGTVRGRLGWTAGAVLAYYTGGFAYGGVDTTINEVIGVPGTFGFSETLTGWTIGSGVEVGLGNNWTAKLEYLYLDLGSHDGAYTFAGAAHAYSSDIRSHIFRAGVNYRIGGTGGMLSPLPTANWNGFYVGANLGTGVGHNESSSAIPLLLVNETYSLAPTGLLGGAQVGYNWQMGNLVLGVEADIQGSAQKDDQGCFLSCLPAPQRLRVEQTLPWFGTLRGRIGYAAGESLLYLTGGLAYGSIDTDISEQLGAVTGVFSLSETNTGWTFGGGIERSFNLFGLLGPGWTAKAEYLYVDLGEVTHNYTLGGAAHTFTSDATSHVFRTGINYHFSPRPVVARY